MAACGVSDCESEKYCCSRDAIDSRNRIATRYRELLADEDRIALPPSAPAGDLHGYHLFVVRVLAGPSARLTTFQALRRARIGVRVRSRLYEMCKTISMDGKDYRKNFDRTLAAKK